MPTHILGISGYYHDSAAALVRDGVIIAAAQEERFTRIRHDAAFPAHAVAYCLREGGIDPSQVDHVVFYEKPLLKFDRLLETYLAHAPAGLASFMQAMPQWLKTKLHLSREIRKAMGTSYRRRIAFTRHHEAHAASAFFPSPFGEAAVLTMDGVGEWDTASIALGKENRLEILRTLPFPHSLGLLYSAFTYHCGFKVNSGEYKLMGLAPYGAPRFTRQIREHLMDLREDGSFRLNLRYFDYAAGLRMTNRAFSDLFEGAPRQPESRITQREMDLAASIQEITEEIVLRMATAARKLTGSRNLCLAGGVALNCVANGRIVRESLFDHIWVQPASGDAGGALGAALFVAHHLLDQPRSLEPRADAMRGSLLGPAFTNEAIETELSCAGLSWQPLDHSAFLESTARELAAGRVVGWFQDRMEFGPRALGSRSILGDARLPDMQARMNLRIKFRESFRPFAPVVLAEDASQYFDLREDSPYMLIVAPVAEPQRLPLSDEQRDDMRDADLLKRVNVPRSTIPAVTHVDYSARVQTVDSRHARLRELLVRFKGLTGCSVLINTSFNVRGEPLVCSPADAIRCFLATDMDVLAIGDFLVRKADQSEEIKASAALRQQHLASFSLD